MSEMDIATAATNTIVEIVFYFRACFKTLPKVMCFNTMRYTFNMVTMMKEKVNTHFSFPMKLNMAAYTEEYLLINKGTGGMCILVPLFVVQSSY